LEKRSDIGELIKAEISISDQMEARKTISDLSCNLCIKAGYTYMYEYFGDNVISSEYYSDLNEFQGETHVGACCMKQANGKLRCEKFKLKENAEESPVNTTNYNIERLKAIDRPLSSHFDNKLVAEAACPTKRSVCGKKRHFLYDHKSEPVEFMVNFGPEI